MDGYRHNNSTTPFTTVSTSLFENNKEIKELLEVASVVMKARPSAVKTWFGDEQYAEMQSIAKLTNLDLDDARCYLQLSTISPQLSAERKGVYGYRNSER